MRVNYSKEMKRKPYSRSAVYCLRKIPDQGRVRQHRLLKAREAVVRCMKTISSLVTFFSMVSIYQKSGIVLDKICLNKSNKTLIDLTVACSVDIPI